MMITIERYTARDKKHTSWSEIAKDQQRILAKMTVKQAEEIESEHADNEDFDFKEYSQSLEFWKRFK
jgi:hypothetical protein